MRIKGLQSTVMNGEKWDKTSDLLANNKAVYKFQIIINMETFVSPIEEKIKICRPDKNHNLHPAVYQLTESENKLHRSDKIFTTFENVQLFMVVQHNLQ